MTQKINKEILKNYPGFKKSFELLKIRVLFYFFSVKMNVVGERAREEFLSVELNLRLGEKIAREFFEYTQMFRRGALFDTVIT